MVRVYGPYQYEVLAYDEIDRENRLHRGICFGECYTDAMQNVEEYFDESLITAKIYAMNPDSVYDLDDMLEEETDLFKLIAVPK